MKNNLFDYYKKQVYEHGYYMCERDRDVGGDHKDITDDIYFSDELDYNVCAEYYGMSVDGFTDDDKKFLAVLGFVPSDFEQDDEYFYDPITDSVYNDKGVSNE